MEQGTSDSVGVSGDEKLAKNRSKRLHESLAMKDKIVVKPKKRPTLPKGMNYVIKKILAHPLRFGATLNFDFVNEIKKSTNEEGVEMFKNTIFGPYLNIPKCNFQGQIIKCLLLLEVQHDNKYVLHEMWQFISEIHFEPVTTKLGYHTGHRSDGNLILHSIS
ncbi:hypothetical protein KY289_018471 [Solanum tuberosum]|nr:hypothetical protein KY289_018471 [Solanum tuberosum]